MSLEKSFKIVNQFSTSQSGLFYKWFKHHSGISNLFYDLNVPTWKLIYVLSNNYDFAFFSFFLVYMAIWSAFGKDRKIGGVTGF